MSRAQRDAEMSETYRGRNPVWRSTEKRRLLDALKRLLDNAPGTAMSWTELEEVLSRLSMEVLRTLHYRVERGLSQSYDEGMKAGQSGGDQ